MDTIRLEHDQRGHLSLVFDRADAKANIIDERFTRDFESAVELIEQHRPKGVLVRSAKSTFFAGGDLDTLFACGPSGAAKLFDMVERLKHSMRRLETLGIPVVACLEGAALGGGWELALACHHRIALSSSQVKVGLPEVTLGLLPGGGGVIRTVRLFGLQAALPLLTEGKSYRASKAHSMGLIHELAEDTETLYQLALTYIEENPQVKQTWDLDGYRMPGGSPQSPKLAPMLAVAPAILHQKTKGVFPAPKSILSVMVEGALVDFETACRIESRYFVDLVCGSVSKNMISTFWYQLNEVKAGIGRPQEVPPRRFEKVGILGAGMMGAGIAYVAAQSGIDVVLKDVSIERANKGKSYSEGLVAKQLKRGRIQEEAGNLLLSRIQPTEQVDALRGCDLVIEAVFEDRALKAKVTAEAERVLSDDVLMASNTSTLPITGLATASRHPHQFIGLHFFSPVDKMKLVEIICGQETSPESLAQAYDFVIQLGKLPIIVNDSRGFFTSRVFGTYTQEGIAMVGEGIAPALIENAAALAGFPVGPLAVSDEVSLTLMEHIRVQTAQDLVAEGQPAPEHPAYPVMDTLLAQNRAGKASGGGFYEYPEGEKKHLWPDLAKHFGHSEKQPSLEEVKDRLLYIMALETARCLEEGVLMSSRDANIGSIFGIGFPAWTGGALQFINYIGLSPFMERAKELADQHGERFKPPQDLEARVVEGRQYS